MDKHIEAAARFRHLRDNSQMSIEDFAALLGITPQDIRQLEAGRQAPSWELLSAIDQRMERLDREAATYLLLSENYAPTWLVNVLNNEEAFLYLAASYHQRCSGRKKPWQRLMVRRILNALEEVLEEG